MIKNTFFNLQQVAYLHSPSKLVDLLGFKESLRASNAILGNCEGDLQLRQYAVVMLENLRRTYPTEWNMCWQYDGFLGYAYFMTYDPEQTYVAYTRALTKISQPPPPQLLIEIAWCCNYPEQPIRYEEAIYIVKKVMEDNLYLEGIEALISFYKSLRMDREQGYWKKKREDLKDKLSPLPPVWKLPETNEDWLPPPGLLNYTTHS